MYIFIGHKISTQFIYNIYYSETHDIITTVGTIYGFFTLTSNPVVHFPVDCSYSIQ